MLICLIIGAFELKSYQIVNYNNQYSFIYSKEQMFLLL